MFFYSTKGMDKKAVEGGTSSTEVVTTDIIHNILHHISPDLELIDYKVKVGTAAGDNYMSVMYALEIHTKTKSNYTRCEESESTTSNQNKTLHIMLKTMPQSIIRRQLLVEMNAFVREAKVYEEVFPAMVAYQKACGPWNHEEIFNQFPVCYVTSCDGKSDYIAMENLKHEGYKMVSRQKGLDFAHSSLVVQHMARMHAISYSMFGGDFRAILHAFPYLEEKLILPLAQMPDVMRTFFQESLKKESNLLRTNGYEAEAHVIDVLGSEKYYDKQYKLIGLPVPNAVIGHGDTWTNNILFKCTNEGTDGSSRLRVKFVDFQISRVSSRMVDFTYFLHTSPQMQIMNERWEHLLQIYHEEFTKYTRRLGCSPAACHELTYEQLLEEFTEYKVYGVVMGIILCPAISAPQEDIPDMELLPESNTTQYTSHRFDQVLGNIMKGETLLTKLLNLVNNHAVKIPFVIDLLKKNVK